MNPFYGVFKLWFLTYNYYTTQILFVYGIRYTKKQAINSVYIKKKTP